MPTFTVEAGMVNVLALVRVGVAQARAEVGDRIGHHVDRARGGGGSHQDALRMPGISPRCAAERRQMRQMPNLR